MVLLLPPPWWWCFLYSTIQRNDNNHSDDVHLVYILPDLRAHSHEPTVLVHFFLFMRPYKVHEQPHIHKLLITMARFSSLIVD